jgi:hypothetical protein
MPAPRTGEMLSTWIALARWDFSPDELLGELWRLCETPPERDPSVARRIELLLRVMAGEP